MMANVGCPLLQMNVVHSLPVYCTSRQMQPGGIKPNQTGDNEKQPNLSVSPGHAWK